MGSGLVGGVEEEDENVVRWLDDGVFGEFEDHENEHAEEEDEDRRERVGRYIEKMKVVGDSLPLDGLSTTAWHELWVPNFCLSHGLGRAAGQDLIDWIKYVSLICSLPNK